MASRKELFGKRVVELREAAEIKNHEALAKLVKMKQPSVWAIENGHTDPTLMRAGNFMRLVGILKTNARYLLDGSGLPGPIKEEDRTVSRLMRNFGRLNPDGQNLLLTMIDRMIGEEGPPQEDRRDHERPDRRRTH